MFELTIGTLTFPFNDANAVAGFLSEIWGEDVGDTLKMLRDLKRDQPHVVMSQGCFYTVEKVK